MVLRSSRKDETKNNKKNGWYFSRPVRFRVRGLQQVHLAPGIHSVVPSLSVAKLLHVASPRLREFSHTLGETVSLAALFDKRMEVIAVNESPRMIRVTNVVGH